MSVKTGQAHSEMVLAKLEEREMRSAGGNDGQTWAGAEALKNRREQLDGLGARRARPRHGG